MEAIAVTVVLRCRQHLPDQPPERLCKNSCCKADLAPRHWFQNANSAYLAAQIAEVELTGGFST